MLAQIAERGEAPQISSLLKRGRGTRVYTRNLVEPEKLQRVFEAARWAPSSADEQPWRYIVATRDQARLFSRILDSLSESNAAWAKNAPVLIVSIARRTRESDGNDNRHAYHDLGQSVAYLTLQALQEGLRLHQIGGFDQVKVRQYLRIPDPYDPVSVIALGYPGDPESLPNSLRERELAPHSRKPLEEIVFKGEWGNN